MVLTFVCDRCNGQSVAIGGPPHRFEMKMLEDVIAQQQRLVRCPVTSKELRLDALVPDLTLANINRIEYVFNSNGTPLHAHTYTRAKRPAAAAGALSGH